MKQLLHAASIAIWKRRGPLAPVWVLLAATAGVGGCGGSGLETAPVSGVVLFNNEPLTTGSVTFVPDASKGNTSTLEPVSSIGVDGAYSLSVQGNMGARPGWYKVIVRSTAPSNPSDPYSVPKSLLPEKYGAAETTDLAVEVVESPSSGAYDLKLAP